MDHKIEVKKIYNEFIDKDNKPVKYYEIVLQLDGWMNIRLDKTKDNYKNLKEIINHGDSVTVVSSKLY